MQATRRYHPLLEGIHVEVAYQNCSPMAAPFLLFGDLAGQRDALVLLTFA